MAVGVYIRTESTRKSLSDAAKLAYKNGKKFGFTKGHKTNVGRIFSELRNKKIGISRKGLKLTEEQKRKAVATRRMNGSYIGRRGEKSHWWRGGISPINERIRKSGEYNLWRKSVFERDNYTCVWCGKRGGELHADHIKPFALFPELRFAIDNGRTLCVPCHRTTDTYGGNSKKP